MKPYYKNELTTIYNGDCLEVMDYLIKQGIKFDAIITDPPYGTTACSWDNVIPFDKMWPRLIKLRKDKTPIVLFGSEPFSSHLRMSNIKEYKYDWIWDKMKGTNFLNAKIQPMKYHEIISVFNQHNYYPQKTYGHKKKISFRSKDLQTEVYGDINKDYRYESTERYPKSIQEFHVDTQSSSLHPTQKPVELIKYLIETYTKKGDLILDFTAGSFTTCIAADQLGRRSIGIELDKGYCDIGIKRLQSLQMRLDI